MGVLWREKGTLYNIKKRGGLIYQENSESKAKEGRGPSEFEAFSDMSVQTLVCSPTKFIMKKKCTKSCCFLFFD